MTMCDNKHNHDDDDDNHDHDDHFYHDNDVQIGLWCCVVATITHCLND